jgi:anti-sigma B factor antagonist
MQFRLDDYPFPVGPVVIEAYEDLDLATAPALRSILVDLHEADHNQIVLDMSGLDFMDSSGLGALIGGVKRARAAGGELVLAEAPERILRLLRRTGVVKILPCFAKLSEAFAHFDEPTGQR